MSPWYWRGFASMSAFRRLIGLLAVLLLGLVAAAEAPQPDFTLQPPAYPFRFAVYGDIRFTDPANTRDTNPAVRRALVNKIADEHPAFVVINGDLVLKGADPADWKVFDRETQPWRQAGLKIFPAIGNHDVDGGRVPSLSSYFARFPELKNREWYSVRDGNLMLFVLDSTSDLTAGSPQRHWLAKGLSTVPADIDFVMIALHHPPYTQSSALLGGHDARVYEQQLAAFLESEQAKMRARIIVVSGHVHNYERYEHGGVMYIVTGGGGATPYPVRRLPGDFYRDPGPTYHFCRFTVEHGQLTGEMVKYLGPGQWAGKDQFELRPK